MNQSNNPNQTTPKKERNLSLDILRVLAIFLVLWQHSNECYYIGDGGALVHNVTTTVGWIDSYARVCIGLFVMISGFLLLPMKDTTSKFFKKRFTRVLFPWIFWMIVFAVFFVFQRGDSISQMFTNIAHIPVNFGVEVGHLWYVYMLIGLYLLVPIISPWLRSCGKKELRFYLIIWAVTTLLPYLHQVWPEIWGECYWNPTPMLYYFTGFIGYFVLGHYIRRYGPINLWLSIAMVIVGYGVTAAIFILQAPHVDSVAQAELPWNFCTLNVVLMSLGTFSIVSRFHITGKGLAARLLVSASVCSYAVYLCHIIILNYVHEFVDTFALPVTAKVALIAVPTFLISWGIVKLLSFLPKAKWWLGV